LRGPAGQLRRLVRAVIEQHVDDLSRLSSLGAAADAARPISRISAPGSIRLSGPITRLLHKSAKPRVKGPIDPAFDDPIGF
jgi:hypothetical protein